MITNRLKFGLKGFTLIELMVAIAIVAILSAVGFSLLQNSQAAGRDSKRRQDIDAIAQALETHWDSNTSSYPPLSNANITTFFSDQRLPSDPIGDAAKSYVYYFNGAPLSTQTTGNSTYVICAKLERGGGNYADNSATPAPGTAFYCRRNQQQ